MNVIKAVQRADEISDPEPCAATDSHPDHFACRVSHGLEAVGRLYQIFHISPDANVDVAHQPHLNAFTRSPKAPRWNGRADFLIHHRERRLAHIASDVQPAV